VCTLSAFPCQINWPPAGSTSPVTLPSLTMLTSRSNTA
jgi:hypothetical protein